MMVQIFSACHNDSSDACFFSQIRITVIFGGNCRAAWPDWRLRYDKWVETENIKADLRCIETLNLWHYFNLEINQNFTWEKVTIFTSMRFKWLNLLVNRYEIILYLLGEWLKKTTEEPGERNTLQVTKG